MHTRRQCQTKRVQCRRNQDRLPVPMLLNAVAAPSIVACCEFVPATSCFCLWQAVSMVGMIAYLSYLVAEHFGCSGIVAIFTCAVVMSHYALYNVPREIRKATRHTAEVFSYMCEGAIFLYVGLDTIDPVTWQVCCVHLYHFFVLHKVSPSSVCGCHSTLMQLCDKLHWFDASHWA